MSKSSYETVIGLEIHVQLATQSKAFCADAAAFGGAPNTHTSAISLAHPGTLPRLNRRAVEYAVRLGLALESRINLVSAFDRKNYFYADLPKGYQITQDKQPICTGGRLTVDGGRLTVDGGRLAVDGGRETVDGGRETVDGRRETVDGGRETVDGRRETVDGGRETVDGGRETVDGERWTREGKNDIELPLASFEDPVDRPPSTVDRPPSAVDRPPSTVDRPPSAVHRPPSTVSRPPSTVYRPPSTVSRPPSTVYRIHHIHLEEDAGKSLHDQDPRDSLIDLNRAGVPLLEIVTEPDLRSAGEVAAFMEAMRRLVRWLGISDGNMEEGSLRCDINVSVRKTGDPVLGQRCEIKNVNSMRFARRAVEFEAERQIAILENGGRIEQETRGFDAVSGTTYSLREKEQAHDYRYFPDPDLPPVIIRPEELERIRTEMPPLPAVLEQEFQTRCELPAYDAEQLTQDRATALYFLELLEQKSSPKLAANLLINKLIPWAAENKAELTECPVQPAHWTVFLQLIESGQLSASAAYQRLFPALLENPGADPAQLADRLNLRQTSDTGFLETLADEVLARFPDKVQEYKKGKKGLIGLFMGELMKASGGKADPKAATRVLEEKLKG